MNKETFLFMSSEIPVYPQQPIIDIGSVQPGPSPTGISTKYDYLLKTISQSELEQETPTLESILIEIERQYHEGIIPTGYQYYYWYYEFEIDEQLYTGLVSNDLFDGSNFRFGSINLSPVNLTTGQTIGVRLYFIYHPTNYATESTQTEWYIGFARDNTPADLQFTITNQEGTQIAYYYSSSHSGKYCGIGLVPIISISSERMYPQNGIKLFGTQRLPIDIS